MSRLVQVFANDSTALGGAEKVLGRISAVGRSLGLEVVEYSLSSFPLRSYLGRLPMVDLAGRIWQLNAQVQSRLRPDDIVVTHGMYGAFLKHPRHIYVLHSTYAAMAAAVQPVVARLEYLVCRYLWGQFLEKRNARRADCVAVSQACQQEARHFYGVSSQLIHNCLDLPGRPMEESRPSIRQRYGMDPDATYLVVAGRREKLKGKLQLEWLAGRLPAGQRILSVGSGPEIAGVLSLPPVAREELACLYRAADWLLAPSLYEGFGLTILEAWACGLPVIASPTGIVTELMGEEASFDRCVAARAGCPEALERAVQEALADSGGGQRQLAWGQRQLAERFSPELFGQRWSNLLASKLKNS